MIPGISSIHTEASQQLLFHIVQRVDHNIDSLTLQCMIQNHNFVDPFNRGVTADYIACMVSVTAVITRKIIWSHAR